MKACGNQGEDINHMVTCGWESSEVLVWLVKGLKLSQVSKGSGANLKNELPGRLRGKHRQR